MPSDLWRKRATKLESKFTDFCVKVWLSFFLFCLLVLLYVMLAIIHATASMIWWNKDINISSFGQRSWIAVWDNRHRVVIIMLWLPWRPDGKQRRLEVYSKNKIFLRPFRHAVWIQVSNFGSVKQAKSHDYSIRLFAAGQEAVNASLFVSISHWVHLSAAVVLSTFIFSYSTFLHYCVITSTTGRAFRCRWN